jgi:hypothetical protein
MEGFTKISILSIPDKYKESEFYNNLIEGDFENNEKGYVYVQNKFSNFDETVNDINDVIRILNLYKYWMVSDNVFYDFILTNKERINIDEFNKIVDNFELGQSLMSLLQSIDYQYKHINNTTDLSLLSYLFNNDLTNYYEFIDFNYEMTNSDVILHMLKENRDELESEKDILDFYISNVNNLNVLNWLKENKMNFNYVLEDIDILVDESDFFREVFCPSDNDRVNYGTNPYINNELTDITLEKFLVGYSMYAKDIELLNWILSFTGERPIEIINMAAYWWTEELFIKLLGKGFIFNEYTCEKAIRGNNLDIFKYLIGLGCQYNITYEEEVDEEEAVEEEAVEDVVINEADEENYHDKKE